MQWYLIVLFFFFLQIYLSIYLFIFGSVGSLFLYGGFLQLRQVGATLHRGARASHHRDLSRCGTQAPEAQAQQLCLMGPAALRHVGSSQTRARTRVPCISRQTLNHCATREALIVLLIGIFLLTNNLKHLLMCFLAICAFSLENCLYKPFAHFKVGCLYFTC